LYERAGSQFGIRPLFMPAGKLHQLADRGNDGATTNVPAASFRIPHTWL
jgi:hypothetical protein